MTKRESKLRALREAAGLTQGQLAEMAGMTTRGIFKWEKSGTSRAQAGRLAKAARALGCAVEDIID